MGNAELPAVLVDGKKTVETLLSTKNQTKTARLLRLSFDQVHGVMQRAVERGLNRRDDRHIHEHVCMDEKSIRRGHEYVSMLYDGDTGNVIGVEAGRTRKSVENLCSKALTEEQRAGVKTVSRTCGTPSLTERRSTSLTPATATTCTTVSPI